jgi:hypothetical protein
MKVHGFEVTPEIERACLEAMVGRFRAFDVVSAAIKVGAPIKVPTGRWMGYVAERVADRLIQRERKAGRIRRVGNRWERVEDKQ